MRENFYEVLGGEQDIYWDGIRTLHQKESLKIFAGIGQPSDLKQAQIVNLAYLVLSDMESRIAYDKLLKHKHMDSTRPNTIQIIAKGYTTEKDRSMYQKLYDYENKWTIEQYLRWLRNYRESYLKYILENREICNLKDKNLLLEIISQLDEAVKRDTEILVLGKTLK